jgi:hypothetical protein
MRAASPNPDKPGQKLFHHEWHEDHEEVEEIKSKYCF